MQIPLEVAFEGDLAASEAVRRRIEREVEKLERVYGRLVGCRVAVIGRSGRHRHGDLFAVHLQLSVPGGEDIFIDRNPPQDHAHEDVYVAVRDAFAAARRKLQDKRRIREGVVKTHAEPPHGKVARLFPNEGYGFVEASDGREIYFHRNAVVNGGFSKLRAGAEVRFAESEGEKGAQASTVHPA